MFCHLNIPILSCYLTRTLKLFVQTTIKIFILIMKSLIFNLIILIFQILIFGLKDLYSQTKVKRIYLYLLLFL